VLKQRGLSTTIKELRMAAECIRERSNREVICCGRESPFETATRARSTSRPFRFCGEGRIFP